MPWHTITAMSSCPHANPIADSPDGVLHHRVELAGLGMTSQPTSARVVRTWVIEATDPDPVGTIEHLIEAFPRQSQSARAAGWLVMLSYELGRVIEPKAQGLGASPTEPGVSRAFPLAVVQRWEACSHPNSGQTGSYRIGALGSSMGRDRYIAAVERTQAYIRSGDLYQANIAHHLQGSFSGCASACFADLIRVAEPRLGSMMIFEHRGIRHAIGSISPELFLSYDPSTRIIRTEPMKGTRPIESDKAELYDSIKDRAELDMITDLMRNDLGRVCTLGSVKVVDSRKIEAHRSGVLQASSAIEGRLADGVGFGQIIGATFPPGSVTGAPKVRAMQILDELEGRARDSYCGAMVVLDDRGAFKGSVSIRTTHIWGEIDPDAPSLIRNGRFVYPVGAGVVADSDPASEWGETLTKAAILGRALGAELAC